MIFGMNYNKSARIVLLTILLRQSSGAQKTNERRIMTKAEETESAIKWLKIITFIF